MFKKQKQKQTNKNSELSWYKSSQERFAETECCRAMSFRGCEIPAEGEPLGQEQL